MKKSLMTGFLGIAFAFAMVACGGNATPEDTTANDNAACEMSEQHCMHHCQMTCPDSVCLAANCENCACPDSSACKQKPQCHKAEGEGCMKAEGKECCKKAEGEGCQKAEGKECCKNKQNGECKKECEKKK